MDTKLGTKMKKKTLIQINAHHRQLRKAPKGRRKFTLFILWDRKYENDV